MFAIDPILTLRRGGVAVVRIALSVGAGFHNIVRTKQIDQAFTGHVLRHSFKFYEIVEEHLIVLT